MLNYTKITCYSFYMQIIRDFWAGVCPGSITNLMKYPMSEITY